jgi:2-polyprenyl-3-methyl-5-hydroxy-6-metoxy-1,4-benzoquinol methylase
MSSLAETSAHRSDDSRKRLPDRAWYAYARRVLPAADQAGRWVDMGCGQGEFLDLVAQDGHAGMGLDFWASNASVVCEAGRPALAADLNKGLPFQDASLDGVTLIEVIEHIVRAEDLVAELSRVIRPGGWLVVTTPNVVHLTYRIRSLTGHPPKQEGYHYRFFTRKTLTATLAKVGFELDGYASFGKQLVLSKLARLAGKGAKYKVRYIVPRPLEGLLAQHFVWRLRRKN